MFRLSREVRFAVNAVDDDQLVGRAGNSYAGFPALLGRGQFFALAATVAGELDQDTSYLINIRQIDQAVRQRAVPVVAQWVRGGDFQPPRDILRLHGLLRDAWPGQTLEALRLSLTPFFSIAISTAEIPMMRMSQKFEFAASHRLHNPAFSAEENRRRFGKCNNPHGHGHNYEVQVTVKGLPDNDGRLVDVPQFERIVAETVIDRFDHKNLNVEVEEFRDVIPSVENIAMVIYRLLEPELRSERSRLAAVTVWETPKTWCEYSE